APLAKVIFTTFLYASPVQIIPAWYQTGTPLHFHFSTTSGSVCLMRIRIRASVSPRQSLSSLFLASISREGESPPFASFEPLVLFFMVVVAFLKVVRGFLMVVGARASFGGRSTARCAWSGARLRGLQAAPEEVRKAPEHSGGRRPAPGLRAIAHREVGD